METLNKHIRWRKEKEILICDCKRMIDLKIPTRYEKEMIKLERGEKIDKKLLSDFKKLGLLANLEIKQISNQKELFDLLDKFLKDRTRTNKFLAEKLKKYPKFFLGLYLNKELIGAICGFYREDYIVISELVIDSKFRRKGFATLLVKEFEKNSDKNINVGALDKSINFYKSLGYKSHLFVQKDKEHFYVKCKPEMKKIIEWRENCPSLCFQYIFINKLQEVKKCKNQK